jgi:thiamine pyrophosphate-dependent acetolactate synthase large subunit-like protein
VSAILAIRAKSRLQIDYGGTAASSYRRLGLEENSVTPTINFEHPTVAANAPLGWVSDVAAEMLRRLGIRYVVQNPGSSFAGLHDSLVNYLGNQNPTMMLALNEQVAIAIAHGYAKVTGEPIAVVMHSNVGLMNGIMGIYNAWVDRVPVYMIGASGPHDATQRTPWIHWIHTARDQAAMIRHFIKWDDSPGSPGALVESMLRANILGRIQPCGPTYICLDVALQQRPLDGEARLPDPSRFAPPVAPEPPDAEIARAVDLLLGAKKPVIMAGRVSRSQVDWDRRIRLAELLGASVVTDLKTAAAFPTDHKLHVGIPGVHFRQPQQEAVRRSDVILALDWIDLGGILNFVYGGSDVTAKVIHCQVDSYVHNGWSMDHHGLAPADVPILADPDRCVAKLLEAVETRLGGQSRWDGKARWQAPMVPPVEDRDLNSEIDLAAMALALNAARKNHEIVLGRAPLGWMPEFYPLRGPLDYLGMDGGAGVGSGPGNSVGHALALMGSGKIAVSVIGDGDLMQGVTALWTAARYRIPAMIVVVNNGTHLNDELIQEKIARARGRPVENAWVGQRFSDPPLDIPGIARSHGVHAMGTVTRVGDLALAFEDALRFAEGGRPVLVDVLCETRVSASSHAEKGVETAGTRRSSS